MIHRIVLTLKADTLKAELYGDLAQIIACRGGAGAKEMRPSTKEGRQLPVVAGEHLNLRPSTCELNRRAAQTLTCH